MESSKSIEKKKQDSYKKDGLVGRDYQAFLQIWTSDFILDLWNGFTVVETSTIEKNVKQEVLYRTDTCKIIIFVLICHSHM